MRIRSGRRTKAPSRTLAERLKLSATLISSLRGGLALILAVGLMLAAGTAEARKSYRSPELALEQGKSAYRGGYYELAIHALEHAAAAGLIEAKFHLARIYSDSRSAHTSHIKAYSLYLRITEEHADLDYDDQPEADFVAKSLVALAGYWLNGLPEAGVRVNATRAAHFLEHAASVFRDEDAQFELAKLYLLGEGVQKDVRLGVHWLSTLTQDNHAGAQAFLAELYFRGKYVEKADAVRALALAQMAVRNAPPSERLWIEGVYQTIFCGMAPSVRRQADGLVADFKRQFSPRPNDPSSGDLLGLRANLQCANGESVPLPLPQVAQQPPQRIEPAPAQLAPGPRR